MSQKQRLSIEEKVKAIQKYLERKVGYGESVKRGKCDEKTFRRWVKRYQAEGIDAFLPHERNRYYLPELKLQAVGDYLAGEGSQKEIAQKLSTPLKIAIFRRNEMLFFAGQHEGVYSLDYRSTCRFEARQVLIYQCISDLTGENGKYNYPKAVHLYPALSDISLSAKNYKIASALTPSARSR